MMGEQGAAYSKYYNSQLGGEIPVFRGGQHGAGLGDILRGLFRFLAPIALRGMSAFASSTLQAHDRGVPLKDAAKGALRPALGAIVSAAQGAVRQQTGSGGSSALFQGTHGIPFEPSTRYKKSSAKRHKKSAKNTKAKGEAPKHKRSEGTKHAKKEVHFNF
jgi:hypothetical protein